MAHEVTAWKAPGCSITVRTRALSTREKASAEIMKHYHEGGALNADYTTVEAALIAANRLGDLHLQYGTHFVFKTGGSETIAFDFANASLRERAREALGTAVVPD